MASELQEDIPYTTPYPYIEPLTARIEATENGFIVTTSGGKYRTKTYIASTLEHAQSILIQHLTLGA
jgi:hypothetical protein